MSTRRFMVKISGPPNDVLSYLRNKEGILYAETLKEQRDSDSTSYLIEAAPNIDIRKPLFFSMAEKGWPIVGLENVGMSLEDIFIKLITGKSKGKSRQLNTSDNPTPQNPADSENA